MTEVRSSKTFDSGFKTYLWYKIKSMSKLFWFTCGLNLLFLISLLMHYMTVEVNNYDWFTVFFFVTAMSSCIGLAVCAGAGAFVSFGHYLHKERTDMVYTLPLTYKQRFFGDLISGYVAGTAPFVPMGAIITLIFQVYNSYHYYGNLNYSGRGAALVLTLFFIYTVTYLVCAVAASCCGKTPSAVINSALIFLSELVLIMGLGLSFANAVTGLITDIARDFCMYLSMPFGTLAHLMTGVLNYSEDNNFLESWINYYGVMYSFPVFNVFVILFYLALSASLIFLA